MQVNVVNKSGLIIATLMDEEDTLSTEVVMSPEEAMLLYRLLGEALEK